MFVMMKYLKPHVVFRGIFALLTLFVMAKAPTAQAAEGGADYYLPGIYGNMGLASLPGPGFYYVNYTVYQKGDLDKAVRFGREQIDLEIDIVANAFVPIYIFDYELFGAHPLVVQLDLARGMKNRLGSPGRSLAVGDGGFVGNG